MARANEGNMHYKYYNQNMSKDQAEDYRYARSIDSKKPTPASEVVYFMGRKYLKIPPENIGEESGTFLIPYSDFKKAVEKKYHNFKFL